MHRDPGSAVACGPDPGSGLATHVGAYPGLRPRLLTTGGKDEDAAAYRSQGGYPASPLSSERLIEVVEHADLRGRGGGAFPLGAKLRAVRDRPGPRHVVANGEEGEVSAVKDRWLLRTRPHLVLDGVFTAAAIVEADHAYVYLSDPVAGERVEQAVAELGTVPVPVTVVRVDAGYVAGEETAVVRAINGGPALPTNKPPRPFESGVCECPTLVSNVETLANLALVAQGLAARSAEQPPGDTFLMTISGDCRTPGLYEVPFGIELGAALRELAGVCDAPVGIMMGGFYGGIIGPRALRMTLSYDDLRAEGTGLGCGAFVVLGPDDCPVAAAAEVMAYFERENARQCGPCIRGTLAMSEVLLALAEGSCERSQLERLQGWATSLRGRGACGTLDAAANLAGSLFREFPAEVDAHLEAVCVRCGSLISTDRRTRFAVGT